MRARVVVARHGGRVAGDVRRAACAARYRPLDRRRDPRAGTRSALRDPRRQREARARASITPSKAGPAMAAVQDELWMHAERHTPHERVADYTQAIMDLGATLCTRAQPACTVCPLATTCAACRAGTQAKYPTPRPKRARARRQRDGARRRGPGRPRAARAAARARNLGRALQPARARGRRHGGRVVRAHARRDRCGRARARDDRARLHALRSRPRAALAATRGGADESCTIATIASGTGRARHPRSEFRRRSRRCSVTRARSAAKEL